MKSDLNRLIAVLAGGAAIVGMATLTAGCSNSTKEAPKTSTTAPATSTGPALSSTEKLIPANPQPVPSISERGPMDSTSCGPGQSKVNGVCQ
ncbi:MAG: hypothetical protein ACKOQ4_06860 [Mycobacterium sp.]